ncbi:MAG: sigma-70 family RNA polymerase sigma factor [Phycisphaerales bacterium]|nr:sigma-70 family RNA polymerase sigma factor [Phycisphaerales bacterium]
MSLNAAALEFALRLARIKAVQLRRRLPWEQVEDIQQELLLAVVQGWTRYDPSRRAEPFIEVIIRHRACKLLERCRHRGRSRQDLLVAAEHAAANRDQHDSDLRHDTGIAMATLAPEVRRACQQLKTESTSSVARSLGIPRSTLDSWLHKARGVFRSGGLGCYR